MEALLCTFARYAFDEVCFGDQGADKFLKPSCARGLPPKNFVEMQLDPLSRMWVRLGAANMQQGRPAKHTRGSTHPVT